MGYMEENREKEVELSWVLYNPMTESRYQNYCAGVKWADEHPKQGMVDIEQVCRYIAINLGCGEKYTPITKSQFIQSLRDEFKR